MPHDGDSRIRREQEKDRHRAHQSDEREKRVLRPEMATVRGSANSHVLLDEQ